MKLAGLLFYLLHVLRLTPSSRNNLTVKVAESFLERLACQERVARLGSEVCALGSDSLPAGMAPVRLNGTNTEQESVDLHDIDVHRSQQRMLQHLFTTRRREGAKRPGA